MNISIENEGSETLNYTFERIEVKDLVSKEVTEKLTQYGIYDNLKIEKFRFNKSYNDLDVASFVRDLISSDQYISSSVCKHKTTGDMKYKKAKCTQINMNILDRLGENGIVVSSDEYIRKTYGETVDEIEISDRLREVLIMKESEVYSIYDETDRSELLFILLRLIVLGGHLNQYEDYLTPYRDVLRDLYKQLVSVRKDTSTNEMYVDTHVYEALSVDGSSLFARDHVQNLHLFIVHPFTRHVFVLRHEFADSI